MSNFEVKDSGKREEYPSGMRRDTQEGKPDYTLIDYTFLTRLAEHLTKGAEKYGRSNWTKANSVEELERFQSSAYRHLIQWLSGNVEEDHAMACVFNIMAGEYVKDKLEQDESEDFFHVLLMPVVPFNDMDWYCEMVGWTFPVRNHPKFENCYQVVGSKYKDNLILKVHAKVIE